VWEFSKVCNEEDFYGINETRGRFLCLLPKAISARYSAKGNDESAQSKLFIRIKSESIIEPIPSSSHEPFYNYRNGRLGIIEVHSSIMKSYAFEFEEDVPSDSQILNGALANLPEDGSCGSCSSVWERTSGPNDGGYALI